MPLFMIGANRKIKNTNKLMVLLKMLDWRDIKRHLRVVHKNDADSQGGQKAYENLKMFKVLLLQQWHSLSDEQAEEALCVRLDFMGEAGECNGRSNASNFKRQSSKKSTAHRTSKAGK